MLALNKYALQTFYRKTGKITRKIIKMQSLQKTSCNSNRIARAMIIIKISSDIIFLISPKLLVLQRYKAALKLFTLTVTA